MRNSMIEKKRNHRRSESIGLNTLNKKLSANLVESKLEVNAI